MVEFEKSPNATFMMVYGIGFPTLSFLLWEFSKSRQFEVQDGPENGEHSPTHWDSDPTTSCRLLLKNVATRNCRPRDSEFQDLNPNAKGLISHWCFIIFYRFQSLENSHCLWTRSFHEDDTYHFEMLQECHRFSHVSKRDVLFVLWLSIVFFMCP